jgi:hypothetical protein
MATAGQLAAYEVRVLGRDGGWRRTQWDVVADREAELMLGIGAQTDVEAPADEVARAPVGTWVRQGRTGALTGSDELYEMFGIPVGTPLTAVLIRSHVHPLDYPLVEQAWRTWLADSEAHAVRFRTVLPDGTTRHLESTGGRWPSAMAARARSAASRSTSRPACGLPRVGRRGLIPAESDRTRWA